MVQKGPVILVMNLLQILTPSDDWYIVNLPRSGASLYYAGNRPENE